MKSTDKEIQSSPQPPTATTSDQPTASISTSNWIRDNKTSLSLVLVSVSCASLVASIWKRTKKTSDFGFQKILQTPGLRGNVQHASWLWAMQAFGISTALVGMGASGLALSAGYYYNVSSVPFLSSCRILIAFDDVVKRVFCCLSKQHSFKISIASDSQE